MLGWLGQWPLLTERAWLPVWTSPSCSSSSSCSCCSSSCCSCCGRTNDLHSLASRKMVLSGENQTLLPWTRVLWKKWKFCYLVRNVAEQKLKSTLSIIDDSFRMLKRQFNLKTRTGPLPNNLTTVLLITLSLSCCHDSQAFVTLTPKLPSKAVAAVEVLSLDLLTAVYCWTVNGARLKQGNRLKTPFLRTF